MTTYLNRRHFIRNSAAAGLGLTAVGRARAASPNNKPNIACIGLGGQMQTDLQQSAALGHNIVAVCDVDKGRLDFTRKERGAEIQAAKFYTDYRQLLEKEKSVDAVIIATPDHWHAMICSAAIQAGKHVYCEKPLAHTVGEARALAGLAKRSKVVTQTGNQGSASGNLRRSIELIQAGMLGDVREVHIWEPAHGWPNGLDRAAGADPVPAGLDWNLWLGPAPDRPYKAGVYHPSNWRGWFDFGGGSIADFCCHNFNLPVRALGLDYPDKIAVSGTHLGKESFPSSCKVRFLFPARAGRGAVTIFFTSGGERPPAEASAGMAETFGRVPEGGCLLVGDKGTISAGRWNTDCYVKLKDEPKFGGADNHDAAKQVPVTLPRAPGNSHMREWTEACTGGAKTFSPFEIGGHITEIGAAGLVALRIGHDIDWDGPAMKVPGLPAADALIKPQARVF